MVVLRVSFWVYFGQFYEGRFQELTRRCKFSFVTITSTRR